MCDLSQDPTSLTLHRFDAANGCKWLHALIKPLAQHLVTSMYCILHAIMCKPAMQGCHRIKMQLVSFAVNKTHCLCHPSQSDVCHRHMLYLAILQDWRWITTNHNCLQIAAPALWGPATVAALHLVTPYKTSLVHCQRIRDCTVRHTQLV